MSVVDPAAGPATNLATDNTTDDSTTAADPQPAEPAAAVRTMRALALACLLGLIVLGLAWELWWAPTGSGTLALKVLPLCLCVLGLMRHRMYTFRWLSLLIWLYFIEGVVRGSTEQGLSRLLALLEVGLCLALFTVSVFYIRRRLAKPEQVLNQA